MESTSEVVWKEQTKSSVSKKSVQEVSSTSVQKLSSSSTLIGEQGVLSILGSEGVAIGDASVMSTPSTAENATILSSPLITSPSPQPDEGNAINTSTLQSEFSAMKLKDDQGNEIGEMVQQKQKQESLKVSSSVLTADNGSKTSSSSSVAQVSSSSTSSSSVVQQSATSMLATAEESSSSSIPQKVEPQTEKSTPVKDETVVDAPSATAQTSQPENNKQDNLNNTLKDIISSIDSNIKAEENIAALKERELELLKKQQELAKEIEQQRLLAQKLANENLLKQQQQQQQSSIPANIYQPTSNVSKYSTFEEKQDENVYSRKSETFETRESTNVSKKIDLHKIFTPATDAEEILPKNRKLYASSAFYSPTLHPTVEDQVELARRISHSLSDISNQQSRGQSMYVNRKKRSVKWVHEGCGQEEISQEEEYEEEQKENNVSQHHEKVPLKFLMNPSGQMRDINSLRESLNTETGLLSPDVSAEVVTALQAQKGKGAELFAKRRKVSEKWVVDESNVGAQSPSGLPDYHQYQQPRPSTSPSILPAYTDAAKHRVQLNLHQEQLLEKYAKPGLKVVQTPWEAALNSGSASAAFVEEPKLSPYHQTSTLTPSPTPQIYDASQGNVPVQSSVPDSYSKPYSSDDYSKYPTQSAPLQQTQYERQQYSGTNSQRELAYKPSIPQGWKAPSMSLPKVGEIENNRVPRNDINNFDHQHITNVIEEAVNSYQEYNSTDETELINLIHDNVKEVTSSTFVETKVQTSKNTLSTEDHEFVNHLIKSPELRLSPIPISTQVIYDNAVQELHIKQLKQLQQQQQENMSKNIKSCDSQTNDEENEKLEKVSVRKHLQQYEDLHRQFAQEIEKEELLHKKREIAKLKALKHNNNKKTDTIINHKNNSGNEISDKSNEVQQTEVQNEDETEYIKVPVKDLITNFEQQSQQTPPSAPPPLLTEKNNLENSEREIATDVTEKLNKDLYMPKEIPLQSYAPPPVPTAVSSPLPPFATNYESNHSTTYKPLSTSPQPQYSMPEPAAPISKPYGGGSSFPMSKPYQQGFSSTYGNSQPPKQQYLPPQSYQKVPQTTSQTIPQVNFNPSPLPYDKLAKFENQPADEGRYINSPPSRVSHLNVRGSKVRNTSPAPFGGSYNRPYTPSSDSHHYGGTPSPSPRPLSSMQQYSGYNTPNQSHPSVTSNQILNAPSYNSSARGWGCSSGTGSTGYQHPQSYMSTPKPQIVNAASMPYTDF